VWLETQSDNQTEELILAKQAENVSAQESAGFTIKSVQTWRAVLRRAVEWKTARYTKGDIEATVVGIADAPTAQWDTATCRRCPSSVKHRFPRNR
jgi:hypothetical protein